MKSEEKQSENTRWPKYYLFILAFNILLIILFYLIRSFYNIS